MGDTSKMKFSREFDALVTIRDELKLKAHLAKADLKDELEKLESKWELVENDLRLTAKHAKEPIEAIGHKTTELLKELKQGYESVRERLG